MFVLFPSTRLQDRRVDRMLARRGFAEATVFYSPVQAWLIVLSLLVLAMLPVVLLLRPAINWPPDWGWVCAGAYAVVAYLAAAYTNNSIAVSATQLIVVNPNFPFRQVRHWPLADLTQVRLAQAPWRYIGWLWAAFGGSYLDVTAAGRTQRFYCVGLEQDAFDENLTERTLDDLITALKARDVALRVELPD